jgi:Zn-dependent M16 (insulinase) family peptidase
MSFQKKQSHEVPLLKFIIEEYEDSVSGARHIHLRSDDAELVFLVAFPTIPQTSDGRAHILEHMSLCGSKNFPVRDPFFSMIKRSMATFMNAMTYPDRTVYPFSSEDPTDFFNLLNVYLDATFFPTLDYVDFQQEAWRLAFDGDKLTYQGIVFNEMKDVFSDPMRALECGINEHILKHTTYENESGGDPLDIPSLSYEALKEFHAKHYHPSQAVFMTSGNLDVSAVHKIIEDKVLSLLPGRVPLMEPEMAMAWDETKSTTITVPAVEGGKNQYGFQYAWLMGESTDPMTFFKGVLLESGLMGDDSTPLMQAMQSAGFGYPSMNHLDANARQMVFHVGMEGLNKTQVEKAKKIIWKALEQAAEIGAPLASLESSLRNLRFYQREVSDGDMPHSMNLLLSALPVIMSGGDIFGAIDVEPTLILLDEAIKDPEFFKQMVRDLLATPTRLDATIVADSKYSIKRMEEEDRRLLEIASSLTIEDRELIERDSAELLIQQRKTTNKDVLPRIFPSQVMRQAKKSFILPVENDRVLAIDADTNGLAYASVVFDVSDIPASEWPWLNLYTGMLPQLGLGKKSYEEASAWRNEMTPKFSVSVDAIEPLASDSSLKIQVEFCAKGLQEDHGDIEETLIKSISLARFDELQRMAFLIDEHVQDTQNDLAMSGVSYASLNSTAALSKLKYFQSVVDGANGLYFYKYLEEKIESKKGLQEIASKLKTIHAIVTQSPVNIVVIAQKDALKIGANIMPGVKAVERKISPAPHLSLPERKNTVLYASAQVNHCYSAWNAPKIHEAGAAGCAVLAELFTNEILHRVIREEGGAYGGNASYDPITGIFRMNSNRDPRLLGTFNDFESALTWIESAIISKESLDEAIISVLSGLDKPHPVQQDIIIALSRKNIGVTDVMRNHYRSGVLDCTVEDLRVAAHDHLVHQKPVQSAFLGDEKVNCGDMEIINLRSLMS